VIACLRYGSLAAAALAGRASDAERLELETHLDACARCRDERASLQLVKVLKGEPAPSLSDVARERVRRAAIAAGTAAARPKRESATRGKTAALALCGGLIAAGISLSFLVRPGDRVLSGDVTVDGARAVRIGKRAELASGGEVLIGGAVVALADGSDAGWRAEARTVELRRGSVVVDLPPGQSRGFRVATERFVVEVVGTRFAVDLDGVRTERGTVRVLSPDGRELARVSAGQSWSLPRPAPLPLPHPGNCLPDRPPRRRIHPMIPRRTVRPGRGPRPRLRPHL